MHFTRNNIRYVFIIILCVIVIGLIFVNVSLHTNAEEGFQTVPLVINPATNSPQTGYYKVTDDKMALIPYGFGLHPTDPRQIIPVTKIGYQLLIPPYNPVMPAPGEKLPDKFYLISDSSLAVLPPNMMPNVKSLDFNEGASKLLIYYKTGYVSETQYYENKYKPTKYPVELPADVYYTDAEKTTISFVPEGYVKDTEKGFGVKEQKPTSGITNQSVLENKSYRDISNNYDMQFHDDVDTILKNNNLNSMEFIKVLVLDACGNKVELKKTVAQGNVTYYNPGEFPFGASKYIPNYEDSVYLGSVGYRTRFG